MVVVYAEKPPYILGTYESLHFFHAQCFMDAKAELLRPHDGREGCYVNMNLHAGQSIASLFFRCSRANIQICTTVLETSQSDKLKISNNNVIPTFWPHLRATSHRRHLSDH